VDSTHTSEWDFSAKFTRVSCSVPTSEAENERIFSISKFIVGDRGGRSKNELMAARTRLKMRAGNAVKSIKPDFSLHL
jgi:hypothetical protein